MTRFALGPCMYPLIIFSHTSITLLSVDVKLSEHWSCRRELDRNVYVLLTKEIVADLMKSHEPWTWTSPFSEDPFHKHNADTWIHGPVHLPISNTRHDHDNDYDPNPAEGDHEHEEIATGRSDESNGSNDKKPLGEKFGTVLRKVWTGLKKATNPPLLGGIAAVVCGLIPFLHAWLFEQGWLSP